MGFEPIGKWRKGFDNGKGREADLAGAMKPTGERRSAEAKALQGQVSGRERVNVAKPDEG